MGIWHLLAVISSCSYHGSCLDHLPQEFYGCVRAKARQNTSSRLVQVVYMIPTIIMYEFLWCSTTTVLLSLRRQQWSSGTSQFIARRSHVSNDDLPADCWHIYSNRYCLREQEGKHQTSYAMWSLFQKGGGNMHMALTEILRSLTGCRHPCAQGDQASSSACWLQISADASWRNSDSSTLRWNIGCRSTPSTAIILTKRRILLSLVLGGKSGGSS